MQSDLIEAGLNEGAGEGSRWLRQWPCVWLERIVVASTCEVAWHELGRFGERSTENLGASFRAGTAPDRLVMSAATPRGNKSFRSPPMVGGMEWALNRDCWRDRHVGTHEVSHQNGDVLDRGHSPLWGRSATNPAGPAAFRTGRRIDAGLVVRSGRGRFLLCVRCWLDLDCQERATEGQPFRLMAIGEESEVSNAMEAV